VIHSSTSSYSVTVRGYSRKRAIAYLFLDYMGCARSVAAEHKRAQQENEAYDFYGVNGTFTKVSGWKSPWALTDHACAYLISRASGTLLAAARVSFVVH
jgi:hypothetical protein